MEINQKKQQGFALLMSIVVVGALLSIGLTVLELSTLQVQLSTNARDSEAAFHAANAGLECGRYQRRINAEDMEGGDSISPVCFDNSSAPTPVTAVELSDTVVIGQPYVSSPFEGEAFIYNYEFTWGTNSDLCTEVTTLVAVSTDNNFEVRNVAEGVPGYPTVGDTLECDAGERCTVLAVRGYNKPCSQSTNFGTVQREVLLEF